MSNRIVVNSLLIFIFLFTVPSEGSQKKYQITGTIEELTPEKIWVQRGTEVLEFNREDLKIPKETKVGDQVTVWYTLNPQKLVIEKEQPGQIDPSRQRIILDDRIFYDAENREKNEGSSKRKS